MYEPVILDGVLSAVLAEVSGLQGAYIVCLVAGGGLLLVSTLFGGDADADMDLDAGLDADFDADVDLDAELDAGADATVGGAHAHEPSGALAVSSWISLRFLIYFTAMFGLTGTALSWMSSLNASSVLTWAIVSGLAIGQTVHQIFRYLQRNSLDSSTRAADYINRTARVTIAVTPPARGEIAIQIGDRERFVPATAKRTDDCFNVGDRVGVLAFRGRTAVIVSASEFDFVNAS